MKGLLADLKHALRLYRSTPGSSLMAVAVLAVGLAFVGAFLSLYVDLLLKPHAGIEDSGRIVSIGQIDGTRFTGIPLNLIERMASEVSSIDAAVGFISTSLAVEGMNTRFEAVTRGLFEGVRPSLSSGRGFESADYEREAEPVAVISDRFWRDRLDADPDVLGTTIDLIDTQSDPDAPDEDRIKAFRIVGVMAPEMGGFMSDEVDFWAPFEQIIPLLVPANFLEQIRTSVTMLTFGRLREGASADALAAELEARYPESTEEFRRQPGFRLDVVPGVVRDINVYRDAERQLNLFLTGSVLLALVAAANVSLFLLARAPGRRRELAIRMSVGAPLKRLARQLASEAGLLVAVSAALGLLVSVWLVNFLRGLAFLRRAEWSDVTLLDWRVMTFVGVFLLILATLVSLAPVLGLKRLGIASSSRQVAGRASLAQRIAGTAQIAIAGTLGGAAVAFGWYLGTMVLGYPGYETENRYQVTFSPMPVVSESGVTSFSMGNIDARRLRETIETIPGVSGFTLTTLIPASQPSVGMREVTDPADPAQRIMIGNGSIDSAFIEVLGLRLLHGRTPDDGEEGAALVNQSFARLFFGRDNVVGEFLDIQSAAGPRTEIVGVLEDLSFTHPSAEVGPILFQQQSISPFNMRGVVASQLPAAELRQALQGLIDSGTLELGAPTVMPLGDLRDNLIAPDKARSLLTIGTASLVVVLAAFGFYGTQRYLVAAGRREYAIRASLGAGPRALGRLVLVRGLLLSLPGLVAGALLAFIVVAWLRDDFISRDIPPGTVAVAVVAGLTLLLLVASVGPARHARRTQPAPLLRED